MNLRQTCLLFTLGVLLACKDTQSGRSKAKPPATDSLAVSESEDSPEWIFRRNGKIRNAPLLPGIYQNTPIDTVDFPFITTKLVAALEQQQKLLRQARPYKIQRVGNLVIRPEQLEETIKILKQWQQTKPMYLHQYLDAHQIWGEDRRGNVQFTGYFTPIIKVKKTKDKNYKYPIYSRPRDWEGPLPTRKQIETEGALEGHGLELAYAQNAVDVYYMHLQGSGFVEYPNQKREYFAYDGTNRHPYRSIEKYIQQQPNLDVKNLSIEGIKRFLSQNPQLIDSILCQNPSYTFFTRRKSQPKGAGGVPLAGDFSIAVDRRYIPLGSCLLAAFPVYDRKTRQLRHEFRIFLAQDVGGAIRGPGHVDVYTGVGKNAQRKASYLKLYGKLWLLLPKQDETISLSN